MLESMNSTHDPSQGTVADRIRRFQIASETVASRAEPASSPPVEVLAGGLRVRSAFGHRKEDSFGPPAGRASRDGPDGARGDSRPPVGMPYPPTQLSPPLAPQAATSLEGKSSRVDDPFLVAGATLPPRNQRSMEQGTKAASEIATVRSRLKSVGEKREQTTSGSSETQYTLAELGSMIDSAIVEQSVEDRHVQQRLNSGPTSPEKTVLRPRKPIRSPRKSVENLAFDPPARRTSRPPTSHHLRSPQREWLVRKTVAASPIRDPGLPSPVKYMAAMFESMQHQEDHPQPVCEAPHDHHIHVKEEWRVVPQYIRSTGMESKLHGLKFGQTIDERSEDHEIPLPSIEGIKYRGENTDTSHDTHGSYKTAQETSRGLAVPEAETQLSQAPQVDRKTSIGWPFKWKPFAKGTSLPPQTDAGPATATHERTPSARPSVVRSKVQELLRRDEDEQVRRQSEIEHRNKGPSHRPSRVIQGELKTAVPNPPRVKPSQLAPLQIPAQEQADMLSGLQPIDASSSSDIGKSGLQHSIKTLKTPIQPSWAEKEVTHTNKADSPATSAISTSPVKQAPSTPVRGRTIQMRQSMSPRYSPYTSEQAFILSPVPSRSQSRGRDPIRVHKVEVEMRDSPERDARGRGEKLMFVRTAAFEEEGE